MSENKLPSRYQLGDKVMVHGNEVTVREVIFTEEKIYYTVTQENGIVCTMASHDVHPEGYVAPGTGTEDVPMLGESSPQTGHGITCTCEVCLSSSARVR